MDNAGGFVEFNFDLVKTFVCPKGFRHVNNNNKLCCEDKQSIAVINKNDQEEISNKKMEAVCNALGSVSEIGKIIN
jgi:hypothetical protein